MLSMWVAIQPKGRGPGEVVKAACLESRRLWVRPPLWHSGFKGFYSPVIRKDSVLWGTCVSVTESSEVHVGYSAADSQCSNFESCDWRAVSFISPSSGGSPSLAYIYVHKLIHSFLQPMLIKLWLFTYFTDDGIKTRYRAGNSHIATEP